MIATDIAKYQLGIGGTDLVFEMSLTGSPARMNYGLIDQNKILPCPSTIGDEKEWKGTFESWMASELHRGRITKKKSTRNSCSSTRIGFAMLILLGTEKLRKN